VFGEELSPALGGLFIPGKDLFGSKVGVGHDGSLCKARWPMSRRYCMPSKDIFASCA
jgi:hypothetical protein